jgi:hypothetical protein
VESDFQHILLRVVAVGGAIMLVAAGALVVAFRAFAPAQGRSRDFRAVILLTAAIAFVLVACGVLFLFSKVSR